jgi:hypothetical protein
MQSTLELQSTLEIKIHIKINVDILFCTVSVTVAK